MGNSIWRIERSRDVKGQGHYLNMFQAHYLDNGWRYRLGCNGATTGNGNLQIKISSEIMTSRYYIFLIPN